MRRVTAPDCHCVLGKEDRPTHRRLLVPESRRKCSITGSKHEEGRVHASSMKASTEPGQNFNKFIEQCESKSMGTFSYLVDRQEVASAWVFQGRLRGVCFQVQGSGIHDFASKIKSLASYQTYYAVKETPQRQRWAGSCLLLLSNKTLLVSL